MRLARWNDLRTSRVSVALDGESWNQMAREITKLAAVVNGETDPDDNPLPPYRGCL
jgi:hypothetical protein